MGKNIDRRDFIKGSTIAGMAGMIPVSSAAGILASETQPENKESSEAKFSFNKDGKFKILQITDTHFATGNPKSRRALENLNQALDLEKPDLVIHTGDIIASKPVDKSLRGILEPISKRKIPFAVALGNHDEEYGKSREEVFEMLKNIPYNVTSTVKGIYGVTNYALTLTSSKNDKVKWVFYVFDSNRHPIIKDVKGYDYIHFDQIAWYREQSQAFTKKNGGKPVPSLAFFHIPLPEYKAAAKDDHVDMVGTRREGICSSKLNSGLFTSMKEMNDVQATFVGHDHNNDFAAYWNKIFLIYGRFSGGDTIYNDLKPNGARVIELTEGEEGFRSWIRLNGGEVIQNLRYPHDFVGKEE